MWDAVPFSGALFVGILVCLELGRLQGVRHYAAAARSGADPGSSSTIETAVFGVMGLFLAFSFSGATQRWDHRRDLVVQETNDIGTAWLRIDLLPAEAQPPLRELFRKYLDSRLAVYDALPDEAAANAALARSQVLQGQIWSFVIGEVTKPEGEKARILLVPAVNAMLDTTTTRTMALMTHPPNVIYWQLFALVLASALVAGFGASQSSRSWLSGLVFAMIMTITVYVVLDLEHPRVGLIRLDKFDQFLIDLRRSMN